MKIIKDIWFPSLILLLSGTIITFFLPFLPVDETRHLTVAWEMKLHDSFLVPLLNNLPYSDKPPFFYWLINFDWLLFGVNEKTLRYIPVLFSVFNIVLVYRIALLLWEDKKIARYATVILASTQVYLVWSALIMFDVILTFWVLLGIYGFLRVIKKSKPGSWLFVVLSIGGGLLTKGPVIFLHILPVSLFGYWWIPKNKSSIIKWYSGIVLSMVAGIAIALLWAVPAAMAGGEAYKDAILWGQTASRVVSSVAHPRAMWYYISLLPVLFFPWVLVKPAWIGFSSAKHDTHIQFLLVWILSTILLFSLISSKQIYYLVPIMPAVSLLLAKNMATYRENIGNHTRWHYPVSICYILLGGIIILLVFIKPGNDINWISTEPIIAGAIGILFLGTIMVSMKPASMDALIKIIGVSSVVLMMFIVIAGRNAVHNKFDIQHMAHVIKEKQEEGYKIATFKKYHGQFQFLGRLTQPIVVIKKKKAIINQYIETHKKVLFLTYEKSDRIVDENEVVYQQLYRGRKFVIWNEKGIYHFSKHR